MRAISTFDILPILLAVVIYVFISSQVYVLLSDSVYNTNLYNLFQAGGSVVLGYFSDMFCRRKTLIVTTLIGLVLITALFAHFYFLALLMLFGFLYNPLSILRASLIDNFPKYSKVQLIGLSFIAQFLPTCFYYKFMYIDRSLTLLLCLAGVLLNLLMAAWFFYDNRNKEQKEVQPSSVLHMVDKKYKKRFFYTLLAFFPAQLVYFFASNLLELYSTNPELYSVIAFASIIGVLVSSLYKKTPHTSVLTMNYGINMMLATIPIISLYLYSFSDISTPLQFIVFAALSGFALPFVYDVVLGTVSSRFRGTTCGILDFVFSVSSLVNLILVDLVPLNMLTTFSLITLFFGCATFLQKRSEPVI